MGQRTWDMDMGQMRMHRGQGKGDRGQGKRDRGQAAGDRGRKTGDSGQEQRTWDMSGPWQVMKSINSPDPFARCAGFTMVTIALYSPW